jgi:hypothetical protein
MKKQTILVWFLGSLFVFSMVICYSLFAVGADPNEPNENFTDATLLTPGVYEGTLELGNTTDVDYYKVAMTAGENLTVQLYNKSFAMSMVLYYPNQTYIIGYSDFLYVLNAHVSGDYYITIDGNGVDTGYYSLKIQKIDDDAFENNDNFGSATPISFNTTYTNLQLMDDDTYNFPLSVWDPLCINVTRIAGASSMIARLCYPNTSVYQSWTLYSSDTLICKTTIRVPGTYYLLLSYENGGLGNYTLEVGLEHDDSYEPNNDFASSTSLTANTHYPHLVFRNPDYFKYTASAGDAFNITITRNSSGSGSIYLYAYRSDMSTQIGSALYAYVNDQKSLILGNLTAGVYYFHITDYWNFTYGGWAKYNLTFNILADDGKEPNNDVDNAAVLTANTDYPNLQMNNDDWYSIALGVGDNITITLFRGGGGYVNMYIKDSDKTSTIGICSMINTGYNQSFSYFNPAGAKTIYVKVEWINAFGGCFGAYNLSLGYIGEDIYEENDVFGDAKLLGFTTYNDLMCSDDDWFKFDVLATQHLILMTTAFSLTLTLYDNTQTQVATQWLFYGVYPCVNLTATINTTYYLKVSGGGDVLYTLYSSVLGISHPADLNFEVGTPNKNITWSAKCLGLMSSGCVARIYRDGVSVANVSVSSMSSGYPVVQDLAGLSAESYCYHLVINGTYGFIITDTVWVYVTAPPGGGTDTTTTDTTTTSSGTSSGTGTNSSSNSTSTSDPGGTPIDESIGGYLPGFLLGGMGLTLLVLVKRRKKYLS